MAALLRSTARLTARAVTGALVLAAVAVAVAFLVPRALGYDSYVITTGSMRGTVDPGGLVVSRRVPVEQLAAGDVITYLPPSASGVHHLVTHRIVAIGKDRYGAQTFRTKGDANAAVDPWTFNLQSAVMPVMRWHAPYLGRPVLWLADPLTRKLALGVPALVLALVALRDVVSVLRRDDEPTPEVPDGVTVIDLTEPASTSLARS